MSALSIQLLCRRSIDLPELAIFASRPGAMINLHWLELPMARTIFHGPKGVRAIEVRLYASEVLPFMGNFSCIFKYLVSYAKISDLNSSHGEPGYALTLKTV